MSQNPAGFYRARRVLVTGGLGFIGSTLARALVERDAEVVVVDALVPGHGGNRFNIEGIQSRLDVRVIDVRDEDAMASAIGGCDVIFSLAGQVSHIDSMRDPHADLDNNCRGPLAVLESCRRVNSKAKVVYACTRQIYGRPDSLPVTEQHPVRPTDVNGIHKAAAEQYHLVYNNVFGIRSCSLRLSNVYGPRQLISHNRQGFTGWFIRLAIEDREIQIFGDGSQLRDVVFVDDVVDAFLRAGATDETNGRVFNVGGSLAITHLEFVAELIDVAGTGRSRLVQWPADKKAIDIGSFYSDSGAFHAVTGWSPQVQLRDGLTRTVAFYRAHLEKYVDPAHARHEPV